MSAHRVIRAAFRGRLGNFELDASFTVPASGVTALFGPSGCGKTTVLRCMAGLQHLAKGFCAIDDDIWQNGALFRPPHRRPIGYVFQEASLFAHLSVKRNLPFLERLHDSLSLPVIYVSHDMAELERLADHIVLMQSGCILATGPLSELQSDPSLPLAGTRDAAVSFDALVESHDANYGLTTFNIDGARFIVPTGRELIGTRRRIRIAASDVSLARERPRESTILNILPVRILSATSVNEQEVLAVLGVEGVRTARRLLAHVTRRSWDQLGLAKDVAVYAQIKSVALAPVSSRS